MRKKKILVVGELNVDLILNGINGFPAIGREIVADTMDFTLGSSSAILASNIKAMGVETSFCGMIGEDQFGSFIIEELRRKGVNDEHVCKSKLYKTGITVVMNYDQDRANVTHCGAMNALKIQHIPLEKLKEFNHLHISSFFLQQGLKGDIPLIFRKAKDAGLSTSLDLQFDPDEKWDFDYKDCLPFVDIFLPNEAEVLAITGQTRVEDAIAKIKPYANYIALKLGEKGSRLFYDDEEIFQPPFLNKQFQDAIGAGDSFNAGFIQKFLEGASMKECLRNGNLMGSLNTTRAGGTAAFPSIDEINKKIEAIISKQL